VRRRRRDPRSLGYRGRDDGPPGVDRAVALTDADRQIGNLIGAYTELIDRGDFDGLADLLADAGVGEVPPDDDRDRAAQVLRGRDRLRALFESTTRRYPDGTPLTKHLTTNLIVDIDETLGRATSRSSWLVLQAAPGLPLQPILAGRYHDRFECRDGRWRFTERLYQVDLVGDVSHHLLEYRAPTRPRDSVTPDRA